MATLFHRRIFFNFTTRLTFLPVNVLVPLRQCWVFVWQLVECILNSLLLLVYRLISKDLRKNHPSQLVQAASYVHHRFEFLFFFSNQFSSFSVFVYIISRAFLSILGTVNFLYLYLNILVWHTMAFFRTLRTILTSFCVYLYIFSRALLNNIVIYGVNFITPFCFDIMTLSGETIFLHMPLFQLNLS